MAWLIAIGLGLLTSIAVVSGLVLLIAVVMYIDDNYDLPVWWTPAFLIGIVSTVGFSFVWHGVLYG